MPDALAGTATAFFLYDVADEIELAQVRKLVETSAPAQLTKVSASNIQYQQPPVVIDGASLGTSATDEFRSRIKAFDYGVVSVALHMALPNTWSELIGEGRRLHDSAAASATAERLCRAASLSQRGFAGHRHVGVDRRIHGVDAREHCLHHLER